MILYRYCKPSSRFWKREMLNSDDLAKRPGTESDVRRSCAGSRDVIVRQLTDVLSGSCSRSRRSCRCGGGIGGGRGRPCGCGRFVLGKGGAQFVFVLFAQVSLDDLEF